MDDSLISQSFIITARGAGREIVIRWSRSHKDRSSGAGPMTTERFAMRSKLRVNRP
jgi:hypothetical protein